MWIYVLTALVTAVIHCGVLYATYGAHLLACPDTDCRCDAAQASRPESGTV